MENGATEGTERERERDELAQNVKIQDLIWMLMQLRSIIIIITTVPYVESSVRCSDMHRA